MSLLKKIGIILIPLMMLCACSNDGGSTTNDENDSGTGNVSNKEDGSSNGAAPYAGIYYVRKNNDKILSYAYFKDATTIIYVTYNSASKEWNEAGAKTVTFVYNKGSILVDNVKKGEFTSNFSCLSLYEGIAIDPVEEFTIYGPYKPTGELPSSGNENPNIPSGSGGENGNTSNAPEKSAEGYAFHSSDNPWTFYYPYATYSGNEQSSCCLTFSKGLVYNTDGKEECYSAKIKQGSKLFGSNLITNGGNNVTDLESGKKYKCTINYIEFTIDYTTNKTTLSISGFYDDSTKKTYAANGSIFKVDSKQGSYASEDGATYRCKEFSKSTGGKQKNLTIFVDNTDDVVKVTDDSGNSGLLISNGKKVHGIQKNKIHKVQLGDKKYLLINGAPAYDYDANLIFLMEVTDSTYDIGSVDGEDCRTGYFRKTTKAGGQWGADNNNRIYEISNKLSGSGKTVLGVYVKFYKFGTTATNIDSESLIKPYHETYLYKGSEQLENSSLIEDDVEYNFTFGTKKYKAVYEKDIVDSTQKMWTITSVAE